MGQPDDTNVSNVYLWGILVAQYVSSIKHSNITLEAAYYTPLMLLPLIVLTY